MSDIKELNKCFESLKQRLYEIEYETCERSFEVQKDIINTLIIGGILSLDFEDTMLVIDVHLEKINILISKLDTLVSSVKFKKEDISPFAEYFHPSSNQQKAADTLNLSQADILKNSIKSELDFYLEKLNGIKTEIEGYNESLGSNRFSNAGFKIQLNLTVNEIGCLFGLLYEKDIIAKKTSDDEKFRKKQLSSFISKNFQSKNKQEDLSAKNIANVLNSKNSAWKEISDKLIFLNNALTKDL